MQVAAEQFISSFGAESAGLVRIDVSIVRGISNASLETEASAVLIGWTETSATRRSVLGSVVDDVVSRVPRTRHRRPSPTPELRSSPG